MFGATCGGCGVVMLFGAHPGRRKWDASFGRYCFGIFFDTQQVACSQLSEAAHPALIDLPDRHDVEVRKASTSWVVVRDP